MTLDGWAFGRGARPAWNAVIRNGDGAGVVVDGDGQRERRPIERIGSAAMLVLDGELQASDLELADVESPLLPMRRAPATVARSFLSGLTSVEWTEVCV